jgi:hypothetical protein
MLPLGILASSGGALKYYITKVEQSSGVGNGAYVDGAGEVVFSYSDNSSPYYMAYSTVNAAASYGVSARWTNSSGSPKGWSIRKSGTSLYLTSFPNNSSSSSELVKMDAAGSKSWSRSLTLSGTSGAEVDMDSSGNAYLVTKSGQTNTGNNKWTVAKYNSSGTIQWQKALQGDPNCNGWSIATTSAGDVYTAGSQSGNTSPLPFVFKLDTSGTKQWVRYIAVGNYAVRQILTDSSGNFYLLVNDGSYSYVIKGDSSGNHVWTRKFSAGNGYDMTIDPSGNIYVLAGGYTQYHYVVKYNSSGTIQWQRSLTSSSGYLYGLTETTKIYANGDSIVFALQETGNADVVLFKLPSNGTLTGTYTLGSYNYTWASSSLSETSASFTWFDFTAYYNANSGSATDAAGNISPSTFTPTTTKKELP